MLRLASDTLFEGEDGSFAPWLRVLWEEAEGPVSLGPDAVGELLAVSDPLLAALKHESLRVVQHHLVAPRLRGTCEVGLCRVKALGPLRRGGRERVDTHVLVVAEEASERIRLAHLDELDHLGSVLGDLLLSSCRLVSRHGPLAEAVAGEGFTCSAIAADDIHHANLLEPIVGRLRPWLMACPEAALSLLDGFLSVFAFRHERRLDPPGARFFRLTSTAMEPLFRKAPALETGAG